ncbi:MAG: hypothetical protein ABI553_08335 [Chloroflexota bacterium]
MLSVYRPIGQAVGQELEDLGFAGRQRAGVGRGTAGRGGRHAGPAGEIVDQPLKGFGAEGGRRLGFASWNPNINCP